jgi:hypothetical protein
MMMSKGQMIRDDYRISFVGPRDLLDNITQVAGCARRVALSTRSGLRETPHSVCKHDLDVCI